MFISHSDGAKTYFGTYFWTYFWDLFLNIGAHADVIKLNTELIGFRSQAQNDAPDLQIITNSVPHMGPSVY